MALAYYGIGRDWRSPIMAPAYHGECLSPDGNCVSWHLPTMAGGVTDAHLLWHLPTMAGGGTAPLALAPTSAQGGARASIT